MADFVDDVASMFVTSNADVLGTTLFTNSTMAIPSTGDGPFTSLIETPGGGFAGTHNNSSTEFPTAQISVRGKSPTATKDKAKALFVTIGGPDGLWNIIINGTWYLKLKARQSVMDMGMDAQGRAVFVFNIEAEKKPSLKEWDITQAISGHGCLIARALQSTPTVFVSIAELGDISLPELQRNEFDSTTQDKDIDNYVLGVLRRGPCTISMNFLPNDPSHDHLTGLQKAIIDNSIDGYKFTLPPGGAPVVWVMSGQVQHIAPKAPVDGKFASDVTIQFTGKFTINGTVIG